jgi:hypothetical protein
LLRLYDVGLNSSRWDLFKPSSYSCSSVNISKERNFNHGITQLKNEVLKNLQKEIKIPVSEPPEPLTEGCNRLKTQSQPVDHASWPECHTYLLLNRGFTAEEAYHIKGTKTKIKPHNKSRFNHELMCVQFLP